MTRDCGHSTGDDQDCGHSTGDDQRLRTQDRRGPETADTVQERTRDCRGTGDARDCGHGTGDDQRLRTRYRG
ncbi:unnamed protein product [Staurois parvus]|uniref:Uncharacterized protein n=1 Tax=Staurois parvus TaxID=386267 RepID=A0ABN9AU42_9NEOB|nr:unnamed protein product [Staurois parvus]